MRSSERTEFQRIFAILLPVRGDAVEMTEPECWLRLAASGRSLSRMNVWQDLFACWVPSRQLEAKSVADAVMLRETVQIAADHQQRSRTEASDLQDWLRRRANDICGAFEPQTGDLFGAAAHGPAWKFAAAAARPVGSVCGGRQQYASPAARGKQHCGILPAPDHGAGGTGDIVSAGSAADRYAYAGAASAARVTFGLRDCTFTGPALPEPFVRFELAGQLTRLGLLANTQGKGFEQDWGALRRQFRSIGGPQSLCNHIIAPLATRLGFDRPEHADEVSTREGVEDGGWIMQAPCGTRLRAWSFASGTDLDAPHRSGRAYRFSPMRSAQRVLLATGERLGLLTDGEELRLLLCDPAYSDSHIAIPLAGRYWVASAELRTGFISSAVGARRTERHCSVAGCT